MQTTFLIRILGTVGTPFAGTFEVEGGPGRSRTRDVCGCIPAFFIERGTAIAADLRNQSPGGILHMELLENGHRVLAGQTRLAYGSVALSRRA